MLLCAKIATAAEHCLALSSIAPHLYHTIPVLHANGKYSIGRRPGYDCRGFYQQEAVARALLFCTIPLLGVILPFNAANIVLLSRARRNMQTSATKVDGTTVIIVVVVAVSLILNFPMGFRNWYFVFAKLPSRFTWFMISLSHTLLILNSSTNFLIYCFVGRDFRRKLRKLCGEKCRQRKASGRSASGTEE